MYIFVFLIKVYVCKGFNWQYSLSAPFFSQSKSKMHLKLLDTFCNSNSLCDQSLTSKMTSHDWSHTSKMTGWGRFVTGQRPSPDQSQTTPQPVNLLECDRYGLVMTGHFTSK